MAPPVIVLGVGRSGTTLLRVMLDRNSEIAIPYEDLDHLDRILARVFQLS